MVTQFCFVRDDKHHRKKHLETGGLISAVKWKVPEDLDLDTESPANFDEPFNHFNQDSRNYPGF